MSGHDLFESQIYIRLADDMHFVYTIKYGGLTIRRDCVPACPGEGGTLEVDQPLSRHSGMVDHPPGERSHES